MFEQAEPGSEFVITRYRDTNANLRTQLMRIIRRAQLKPWPRLFQNLRSSRETELAERWPLHVVCAWIGNSQLVAAKHYLQVTEDHFAGATKSDEEIENPVQNPVQQPRADVRNASRGIPALADNSRDCNDLRTGAEKRETGQTYRVGQAGFEPALGGF